LLIFQIQISFKKVGMGIKISNNHCQEKSNRDRKNCLLSEIHFLSLICFPVYQLAFFKGRKTSTILASNNNIFFGLKGKYQF
jgi:hypothetical protein